MARRSGRWPGPLAAAGLGRVTVSLDSLDDAVFGAMNGVDFPVARVLDGIAAAAEVGLAPIKVNMVVRRGMNETSILPMARWARDAGVILRFIEYMDVGHSNGWRLDDVVPAAEILAMIDAEMPLEPVAAGYRGRGGRALPVPRRLRARWASSRPSRGRSAAIARARGCRPRASSTRACSRCTGPTSRGRCAREPDAELEGRIRGRSGKRARTAIPSCAARRPSGCPRWRCSPSGVGGSLPGAAGAALGVGRARRRSADSRSSTALSTWPGNSWMNAPGSPTSSWTTALVTRRRGP